MSTYGHQDSPARIAAGEYKLSTTQIDKAIDRINRQLKLAAEDFGSLLEIVHNIFTTTGGKKNNFPILAALFEIGKGRFDFENDQAEWFDASHEALIDPLVGRNNGTKHASQKKSVERAIKGLRDNQEEAGVLWVDYEPGSGFGKVKPRSSEFRLVILEYAIKADERVKADPKFYGSTGPGSKWKNAALEVAAEIPRQQVTTKPKGTSKASKKLSPIKERDKAFKAIVNWLKTMQEAGVDDFGIERHFQCLFADALSHVISRDEDQEAAA